jgi:RTC4-like domain
MIFQTKHNYKGRSLHPNARDMSQSLLPAKSSSPVTLSANMEEDYMRPPIDSSEEETPKAAEKQDDTAGTTAVRKSPSSKRKREEPTMPSRQSKRKAKKLQDTEDLPPTAPAAEQPDQSSRLSFFGMEASQPRSQRQRMKTYANRQKHEFKAIPRQSLTDEAHTPRVLEIKLQLADEEEAATKPEMDLGDAVPASQLGAKPTIDLLGFDKQKEIQSSASTATTEGPVFDLKDSSPLIDRKRSGSTSSLTSLSDDDEVKPAAKPNLVIEEDPYTTPCPMCRKPIERSLLSEAEKNPRSLPLQKQRDICHRHKLSEAKTFAAVRGYPTINWADLEHTRISKFETHLRSVLQRERPSYYLDQLDKQVTAAKGKPKELRTYLHRGVLDIAKPGYYGPKGEKIMVHAVTLALSKDLRAAMKTDRSLRAAGIGPYVAAVLAPELTMRLVMEDRDLEDQEEAREVLSESTDVGRLLYPDDDYVDIGEDD